jgi:hypothetical protein
MGGGERVLGPKALAARASWCVEGAIRLFPEPLRRGSGVPIEAIMTPVAMA